MLFHIIYFITFTVDFLYEQINIYDTKTCECNECYLEIIRVINKGNVESIMIIIYVPRILMVYV